MNTVLKVLTNPETIKEILAIAGIIASIVDRHQGDKPADAAK